MKRCLPGLLGDIDAGEQTVGGDTVGSATLDRLAKLPGACTGEAVELGLHPPRAVERGALLDRLDFSSRDRLEDAAERSADVLGAQVTRDVVRDGALRAGNGYFESRITSNE
jgi:hypothetical protein